MLHKYKTTTVLICREGQVEVTDILNKVSLKK